MITVALAVCLLFDRRGERVVRALWDQLESLGLPSLRSHTHGRHVPHLSYAVLRSWDLASVSAALGGLDAGDPVDLSFDGIGLFRRGRAWLLAGTGAGLAARQERVAAAVYDVLPLRARLDRAALINSATGELWPLETLP